MSESGVVSADFLPRLNEALGAPQQEKEAIRITHHGEPPPSTKHKQGINNKHIICRTKICQEVRARPCRFQRDAYYLGPSFTLGSDLLLHVHNVVLDSLLPSTKHRVHFFVIDLHGTDAPERGLFCSRQFLHWQYC